MGTLLYGTGMRLMACVRLRVKDEDFERGEILIRDGKGAKDRVTMLPASIADALKRICRRAAHCSRRTIAWAWPRYICPTRRRADAQVSQRAHQVGLAVRVSLGQLLGRSAQRGGAAP